MISTPGLLLCLNWRPQVSSHNHCVRSYKVWLQMDAGMSPSERLIYLYLQDLTDSAVAKLFDSCGDLQMLESTLKLQPREGGFFKKNLFITAEPKWGHSSSVLNAFSGWIRKYAERWSHVLALFWPKYRHMCLTWLRIQYIPYIKKHILCFWINVQFECR